MTHRHAMIFQQAVHAFAIFAIFCSTTFAFAAAPTLSVKASRTSVYLGESFLLEVKVDGSDNPGALDLSAIRNGTVELLGSQSASHYTVVVVNGKMKREDFSGRIFTYKVTPAMDGVMTAGPITARVNGKTLSGTGPDITVTGVTPQDLVIASVSASRATVLVDEPFEIQMTVRIKALPAPYQDTEPLFPADPPHLEAAFLNGQEMDGLKGPDLQKLLNDRLIQQNQPGFTLNAFTTQGDPFDFDRMFNVQGRPARFKFDKKKVTQAGKSYWEYSLTASYSPLTEGAYTFGPLLFKGKVPVEVKDDGNAEGRPVFAVGPAATVRVIPPPEENRPDSYIGAIGSNLTVEAALDAQTCNVGDPLKLTLTLSGAVQMRNITPPKLSLQPALLERFEIYDDSVQTVKQNGQCQYAYTLRPRQAGSFELPPVDVSFYDVTLRRYQTVHSLPIPLKVRQAAEITASQIIGGSTNVEAKTSRERERAMLPAGIRMGLSGVEAVPLLGNPRRLLLYAGAGPLVFILCLSGRWLRRQVPAYSRAQRKRQALARAKHAIQQLAERSDSAAHRERCEVLRRYLADRLDIQAESLTPVDAEALLTMKGIPYDLAKQFSRMMQVFFDASFGSGGISPATPELLATLAAIDAYRNDRPGSRRARMTLLVLMSGLCVSKGEASTPAERTFIWTESLMELCSAQEPKDFLAVAGTCQKLVDLGVRNADLFYNQGTALLLANRPSDAVAVLLRAERYGGSTADISRNLAIAEARKQGLNVPVASWVRWVFFWHYALDCATRASIAALAFSGLWLGVALSLVGARRLGKALLAGSVVIVVLAGSSVLTTLHQESQVARPASLNGALMEKLK